MFERLPNSHGDKTEGFKDKIVRNNRIIENLFSAVQLSFMRSACFYLRTSVLGSNICSPSGVCSPSYLCPAQNSLDH